MPSPRGGRGRRVPEKQQQPQQQQQQQPQQQQQQQPNMSDDSSELALELNDHDATEALLALQSSVPCPAALAAAGPGAAGPAARSGSGCLVSRFGSPRVSIGNNSPAGAPCSGRPSRAGGEAPCPAAAAAAAAAQQLPSAGLGLQQKLSGQLSGTLPLHGLVAPTRGNSLQSSCSLFVGHAPGAAPGPRAPQHRRSGLASEADSLHDGPAAAALVDERDLLAPAHEALDSEEEAERAPRAAGGFGAARGAAASASQRALQQLAKEVALGVGSGSEAEQAHRRLLAASLMLQAISDHGA